MIPSPSGQDTAKTYLRLLSTQDWIATYVMGDLCQGLPYPLNKEDSVRLEISSIYPDVVKQLIVDRDGISCTLFFNRRPHALVIPWKAVIEFLSPEDANKKSQYQPEPKHFVSVQGHKRVIAREGNVVVVRFGK